LNVNNKEVAVGIDEAGRGPVIGDMFVAGVIVDPEDFDILTQVGVRDSKSLTRKDREVIFPKVIEISKAVIVKRVPPNVLDKRNINRLYVEKVLDILKCVKARGYEPSFIYVDSTSNPKYLIDAVKRLISNVKELRVVYRADVHIPVVSAASIIAKYLRDKHIEILWSIYGYFGSGYPSDPRTLEWLRSFKEGEDLPPIIRKSWATLEKLGLRREKKSKTLLDFT